MKSCVLDRDQLGQGQRQRFTTLHPSACSLPLPRITGNLLGSDPYHLDPLSTQNFPGPGLPNGTHFNLFHRKQGKQRRRRNAPVRATQSDSLLC